MLGIPRKSSATLFDSRGDSELELLDLLVIRASPLVSPYGRGDARRCTCREGPVALLGGGHLFVAGSSQFAAVEPARSAAELRSWLGDNLVF